jgi:hypothetical protein
MRRVFVISAALKTFRVRRDGAAPTHVQLNVRW